MCVAVNCRRIPVYPKIRAFREWKRKIESEIHGDRAKGRKENEWMKQCIALLCFALLAGKWGKTTSNSKEDTHMYRLTYCTCMHALSHFSTFVLPICISIQNYNIHSLTCGRRFWDELLPILIAVAVVIIRLLQNSFRPLEVVIHW